MPGQQRAPIQGSGTSSERGCIRRKLLVEKEAHLTLLQALHTADFEELPMKHNICEVLSKLGGSDPDTSSTVRMVFLMLWLLPLLLQKLRCIKVG